jgi:phosphopantothenoylcysteine synthetase/decarboxylase
MAMTDDRVLYVVACGAPPTRQLPEFVQAAQAQGWTVCVIATPSGARFADIDRLEQLTGYPVRTAYKDPDAPDVLPPADVMVVAPASFNTINKWAGGISDTLALGMLCEAIGLGMPLVACPWPNAPLAAHPAFSRSLEVLAGVGVRMLFDRQRLPKTPQGPAFPWAMLEEAVEDLLPGRAGG